MFLRWWRPVCMCAALVVLLAACSTNRARLSYRDPASPDWLTPRATPANTGSVAGSIVNEPYTVLWTTKTGGVAATEPVVRDGLIFFSGLDRRVEVFDLETGKRLWRRRFDGPVLGVIAGDSLFGVLVDQAERRFIVFDLRSARERHSFKVPTVGSPPRALSDSTVILGTWHGALLCYTLDGEQLWKSDCEGPILAAPAVVDSVVYAASGRSLFALDAKSGSKLWEHGVSGAMAGAPAVDQGIYFGAADSFATALELDSGEMRWSHRLGGGVFTTPAIGSELVYYAANDGSITALDKKDGALRWKHIDGAIANLSPTLSGNFLLSTSRQSTLTVLDALTGIQFWSDTTLSAQATTPPVVVGDRIILTDSHRRLICLAPATQTAASK